MLPCDKDAEWCVHNNVIVYNDNVIVIPTTTPTINDSVASHHGVQTEHAGGGGRDEGGIMTMPWSAGRASWHANNVVCAWFAGRACVCVCAGRTCRPSNGRSSI